MNKYGRYNSPEIITINKLSKNQTSIKRLSKSEYLILKDMTSRSNNKGTNIEKIQKIFRQLYETKYVVTKNVKKKLLEVLNSKTEKRTAFRIILHMYILESLFPMSKYEVNKNDYQYIYFCICMYCLLDGDIDKLNTNNEELLTTSSFIDELMYIYSSLKTVTRDNFKKKIKIYLYRKDIFNNNIFKEFINNNVVDVADINNEYIYQMLYPILIGKVDGVKSFNLIKDIFIDKSWMPLYNFKAENNNENMIYFCVCVYTLLHGNINLLKENILDAQQIINELLIISNNSKKINKENFGNKIKQYLIDKNIYNDVILVEFMSKYKQVDENTNKISKIIISSSIASNTCTKKDGAYEKYEYKSSSFNNQNIIKDVNDDIHTSFNNFLESQNELCKPLYYNNITHNNRDRVLVRREKLKYKKCKSKLKTVKGTIVPVRNAVNLHRFIRNQSIVNYLKNLYDNRCQICRIKLQIGTNQYFSEVHHIQPLGNNHKGPDIISNMIVLCPNCHTQFDKGAIGIDPASKKILYCTGSNKDNKIIYLLHEVGESYFKYHNENIFNGEKHNNTNDLDNSTSLENINVVNYGDTVKLRMLDTQEEFIVSIEQHFNRHLMTPFQKSIIGTKAGSEFEYLRNRYKIISTEK